jgi:hypothetical protein
MEKAGTTKDVDKIRDAFIHNVEITLPSGHYSFDENGFLVGDIEKVFIKEIVNGLEVNYELKEVR